MKRVGILVFAMAISAGVSAQAAIIDLTSGAGSTGTINSAIYQWGLIGGGSGLIDSFVRVQKTGQEEGYNTSGRPVAFDENTSPTFTHNLQLSQIDTVSIASVSYYRFILDVNENSGGNNEFISLDDVQIYTSATGSRTTAPASLGTLRYAMDAAPAGDSVVLLDYSKANGSGTTDMTLLVPTSNFATVNGSDYVYLYSHFGGRPNDAGHDWDTSAGFEEWAVLASVPEPTSLGLLGASLLATARRRR